MDEFLSEKEQIQYIREWWRENRLLYIYFRCISYRGRNWDKYMEVQCAEIINWRLLRLYESLAIEISENNLESGSMIAEEIYTDHADSIYADQARLAMAYFYMNQSRDEDAAKRITTIDK